MALTGIEIFKLLPKTNCGDCGVPTCLAFAMSLAAGKAELSKCPHVSEEAKSQLMLKKAISTSPGPFSATPKFKDILNADALPNM